MILHDHSRSYKQVYSCKFLFFNCKINLARYCMILFIFKLRLISHFLVKIVQARSSIFLQELLHRTDLVTSYKCKMVQDYIQISGPSRMTATNSIMTTPSHLASMTATNSIMTNITFTPPKYNSHVTAIVQHQLTFPGAVPHHTMISCSVSSVYTKFLVQSPSFSSVTTRRLHKPKYYGFILLK